MEDVAIYLAKLKEWLLRQMWSIMVALNPLVLVEITCNKYDQL